MKKFFSSVSLLSFAVGISIGIIGTGVRADMRGSGIFPDVDSGTYYDDAVGEMYSKGIITGYTDGRFGPNDFVTRGQVAVIMNRFMDQIDSGSLGTSSRSRSSDSSTSSHSSDSSNDNGAFRFTVDSFNISESSATASVTIVRTSGKEGAVTIEYETSDDTATAGEDYTAMSGIVNFADGESTKNISITIKEDEDSEDSETFKITLKNPTGGSELSDPAEVTITIIDNDSSQSSSSSLSATDEGALGFSATAYAISEDTDTITIFVERTEGTKGTVSTQYATSNDTADSGDEYDSASGTFTFNDGETAKSFTVTINDNDEKKGNKKFKVTLSNPTGGAVLGTSTADIIIVDDENISSGTGTIKFASGDYDVVEGDDTLLSVIRLSGTVGEVKVDFATVNGTAKSGFDYETVSGTLTFREGEQAKIIRIPTMDDSSMEATETFTVNLSNPTNGVTLSTPSSATVNIFD